MSGGCTTTSHHNSTCPSVIFSSATPKTPAWRADLIKQRPELTRVLRLPCRPEHATNRRAAVLILLFEREGSLRVLLTTRSKNLRSHPGQTALPGGRYEETDQSLVATAVRLLPSVVFSLLITPHTQYREAFEEVALDIKSPHLRTVTTLPPFISARKLIVTPIVGLLTDPSVLNTLVPCQHEVDLIFDHPVKAFLDPTIVAGETLAPKGSERWVWESELYVCRYIFHSFPGVKLKGLSLGFPRFYSWDYHRIRLSNA